MEFGDQSLEFFEMAAMVLECMENAQRNTLDLALYVQSWSEILLRYEHDEVRQPLETLLQEDHSNKWQFVGRESLDCLVYGLSHLLHRVLQYGKTSGKTLPIP